MYLLLRREYLDLLIHVFSPTELHEGYVLLLSHAGPVIPSRRVKQFLLATVPAMQPRPGFLLRLLEPPRLLRHLL